MNAAVIFLWLLDSMPFSCGCLKRLSWADITCPIRAHCFRERRCNKFRGWSCFTGTIRWQEFTITPALRDTTKNVETTECETHLYRKHSLTTRQNISLMSWSYRTSLILQEIRSVAQGIRSQFSEQEIITRHHHMIWKTCSQKYQEWS